MNKLESDLDPNAVQPSKLNHSNDELCQPSISLDISQSYLDESQLMNSIHNDHQIYSQAYSQKGLILNRELFTIQQYEHGESGSKSLFDDFNHDETLLLSSIEKSNKANRPEFDTAIDSSNEEKVQRLDSKNQVLESGERISQTFASSNQDEGNKDLQIKEYKQSKNSKANSIQSCFNPHPTFEMQDSDHEISSKDSIDSSMLIDMVPLAYLDEKECKIDQNLVSITSQISNISIQSAHDLQVEKEIKAGEYERTMDSTNQNINVRETQNNSQRLINSPQMINQVRQKEIVPEIQNKEEDRIIHQSIMKNSKDMPQCALSQIKIIFNQQNEVTMKFVSSKENVNEQSKNNKLRNTARNRQEINLPLNRLQRGVQTSPMKQKKISLLSQQVQNKQMEANKIQIAEQLIEVKADKYLNNPLTTEHDHLLFESELVPYIYLLFEPKPRNLIGQNLFKNGLVMMAIIKLITRPVGSPFILNHLYEYLFNLYPIQKNRFIFVQQLKKAKRNYDSYLEQKYNERKSLETQQDVIKRRSLKQSHVQFAFPSPKVNAEQQTKLRNLRLGSTIFNINQNIRAQRVDNISRQYSNHNQKQSCNYQRQDAVNTQNTRGHIISSKVKLLQEDNTLLILSDRLKKIESLSNHQERSPKQNQTNEHQRKNESKQSIEQIQSQIRKDLYERYKLIREARKSETKAATNRQRFQVVKTRQDLSQSNRSVESKAIIKPVKRVQFLEDQDSKSSLNVPIENKKNKKKLKKSSSKQFSADESEAESQSSRRAKPRSKR